MRRPRILFSYLQPTSFVRDDLSLLAERYDVRSHEFGVDVARGSLGKAAALVRGMARLSAWTAAEAATADLLYGWFADYHIWPLVRQRRPIPLALAMGGYDAMDLPDLGYGVFASSWRGPLAKRVLGAADALFPVSGSLVRSQNTFLRASGAEAQGVAVHVPRLQTKCTVVPTGYDPDAWPLGAIDRKPSVLSVATVDSHTTFLRKGLDVLIEVARAMPDVPFQVVGMRMDEAAVRERYHPPANVEFIRALPREMLAAVYGQASVYLQLSRAEGMPNVLCEAMLCGCAPVGSNVFGIPDAIGDAGWIVDDPDPLAIAAAVREALAAPEALRRRARAHIADTFPRERRRRELFGLLDALLDGERPGVPACDWPLA
ncbi:glycosyltransferase family 4 protein [Rubricoccus marinus]|uniref:Glycosyl transferase family 1 domain-containing protein n=1 Tax=Rubricoccus marinus TaxID=716817 RepID=A0A259TWA7_9BACT|nr:glycosyltransferase family 4 protein [Rubricoccus marinus]OZC02001.1 hypothetical protein BSZ36_02795 [Rubricoccus marinus]